MPHVPLSLDSLNVENAEKLLDHLRLAPDDKFDMGKWLGHNGTATDRIGDVIGCEMEHIYEFGCGTSACLAGHAVAVAAHDGWRYGTRVAYAARDWLGLSGADADLLFYGNWNQFIPMTMAQEMMEGYEEDEDELWITSSPLMTRANAIRVLEYVIGFYKRTHP